MLIGITAVSGVCLGLCVFWDLFLKWFGRWRLLYWCWLAMHSRVMQRHLLFGQRTPIRFRCTGMDWSVTLSFLFVRQKPVVFKHFAALSVHRKKVFEVFFSLCFLGFMCTAHMHTRQQKHQMWMWCRLCWRIFWKCMESGVWYWQPTALRVTTTYCLFQYDKTYLPSFSSTWIVCGMIEWLIFF